MLARFDDGAPALAGANRRAAAACWLWTSTLDLYLDATCAIKPVYLPFVHQMARHLADYRQRANWATSAR